MKSSYINLRLIAFILLFSAFSVQARDLQEILKSGVIYIGFDESELGSINYKMAYEFADYMDLEVEEVIVDWGLLFSKDGVRPDNLETDSTIKFTPDAFKRIDLYCGNVTPLEWRDKLFDFAYTLISAEVVVTRNNPESNILNVNSLKGKKLAVMGGTSFIEHLNEINKKIGGGIIIQETKTSEEAKNLLRNSKVDGIVLDGPEALNFIAESHDAFKLQIPITSASHLAWAIENNNQLRAEVSNFMAFIQSNGNLDRLFEIQYGSTYKKFEEKLESHTPVKIKQRDLDEILKDKKLIVSFRERDFVYKKDGSKQFVQILAEEFANYLGVELEYVVTSSFNDYWKDRDDTIIKDSSYTPEIFNNFDLACDIFAPLAWRVNKVSMVKVYQSNYDVLAKKSTPIHKVEDLKNFKGATAHNTLYEELLKKEGAKNFYMTKANNMVPAVIKGKADYTLIYNSFLYPTLETKISLGTEDISWAMRYNQPKLRKALEEFIAESSKNGLLNALGAIAKGEITTTNIEDYLKTYYSASQKGTLPHIVVDAENGLPQEDVNCMFQDDKGFLWFGTHFGLVNYNGKKMKKYHTGNGLISNSINDIVQDHEGRIVVATEGGISYIHHNQIVNINSKSPINHIYIDLNHNVWLISNSGVGVLKENTIEFIDALSSEVLGHINSIQEDTMYNYIISTSKGIFVMQNEKPKKIWDGATNYAFIDSKEGLWFTNREGTYYSEKGIGGLTKAIKINKATGIPISTIQKIKEGFDGSIWLQNTHNLYQVTSINQSAIEYSTGKDLINNIILSFLQDREQNLWIGYSGGLQKIRNNKSLRNFLPKDLDYYISSIEIDPHNNIWITSNNGLFYYSNTPETLDKIKGIDGITFVKQSNDNQIIVINEEGIYTQGRDEEMVLKYEYNFSGLKGVFLTSDGTLLIWRNQGDLLFMDSTWMTGNFSIQNIPNLFVTNCKEFNQKIYISTLNEIFTLNHGKTKLIYEDKDVINGLGESNDQIYFTTLGKIINLLDTSQVFLVDENLVIKDIIPSRNRSFVWLSTNEGVYYFNTQTGEIHLNITTADGLPGNEIVDNGLFIDKSGILWILTYHGISTYNLRSLIKVKYAPKCYLSQIQVNGMVVDSTRTIFAYNENDFVFQLSGLFFSNEKSIEYEYYLRGEENSAAFKRHSAESILYYDNLAPGNYELVYRAKGEDDIWSESKTYKFSITKALWNTWIFRIAVALMILGLVVIIYRWRLSRIKKQKQHLENLVEERTQDLVEANKEVMAKNEEITSSIHYAERIQQSLLPKKKLFEKRFKDHFIIFMPRDIVSGDFFWAYERGSKVYISAVDCTGHGVPGAFMSMLGMSFLKEIVTRHKQAVPGKMLNDLRQQIITALQQEGTLGEAKDGMDMSLVSVDTKTLMLEYAGANNPIYIIREEDEPLEVFPAEKCRKRSEKIFEITPNKMPIAIFEIMKDFDNVKVQLKPGDRVYLFSDGYPDQFGGPKNKKLMYPRLRNKIEEINPLTMEQQKEALMTLFKEWKGSENQIDDVTMIGFKV